MNPEVSSKLMKLLEDLVFVFGSNKAGRHGKGAAKSAMQWGAKYGQGRGLAGRTYALPTKDKRILTLPLPEIAKELKTFEKTAMQNPDLPFLMTPVGTGLAGYKGSQVAELLGGIPKLPNVALPKEFRKPLGVDPNDFTLRLMKLLQG